MLEEGHRRRDRGTDVVIGLVEAHGRLKTAALIGDLEVVPWIRRIYRDAVPDEVVRRANQIELVDMTAEALRRRMAHGNIYPPEKIDAALANSFRLGNLTALRELSLLWLADRVALTGGPEGDTLIRRAARIAAHAGGQRLPAVRSYLSPQRQLAAAAAALTAPWVITAVLAQLRDQLNLTSQALIFLLAVVGIACIGDLPAADPQAWETLGVAGTPPARCPAEADVTVPIGPGAVLALRGRVLPVADQRVLTAFGEQVAVALDHDLLARQAAAAKPAIEADRIRTALLTAVSHDLRTPLAAAQAAVTSLRNCEISWNVQDSTELLATADESLQRLARLIDNLLDLSRLQAGALAIHRQPVVLDELVPITLDAVGPETAAVHWQPAPGLPPVLADPVLLERVIANLVTNALRYSPTLHPPVLTASALADQVELRVIDRGPGIPEANRDQVFVPFQRLGDRDNTTGLGLGLALSRGLIEAMGGSLTPEDTPGGGLTMIITLHPSIPEPGTAQVSSEEIPA